MRSVLVSRRLAHVLTSTHSAPSTSSIPSTDSHHLTHPSVHHQHKNSYIHGTSNIPLRNETLGQTLRNTTERVPDKEFCAFLKYPLRKTYEEFYHDVRQMAASLYTLGLEKGDRVGVWGPNYYEWVVLQYACAFAGVIQVNVNPHYLHEELRFVMRKTGMKVLFAPKRHKHSNYVHTLIEAMPEMRRGKPGVGHIKSHDIPDLRHIVLFGDDVPVHGAWVYSDLMNAAGTDERAKLEDMDRKLRPDEPVNMQFTSGTTGHPKGATLTHFGLNNNAYFAGIRLGWDREDHRICIPNPLYHCFGCAVGVINAVNHGQTVVFPSKSYHVPDIFEAIQNERCTTMFGTPTMFIDVLKSPLMKQYDISSLRGGVIGGAPCPLALCEKMVKEMRMTDFAVIYGSTETSPLVTMSELHVDPFERIKSVGSVMPHQEIAIVDEYGVPVPTGAKGELWSRGYSTMLGYWADQDKTNLAITRDRWYKSGDTAVMNEDGTINIVGRTRDMIVKGGENVYPTEVEQFLHKLDYVADAHVVGVPDDRYGENICAWVRLRVEDEGKIKPEQIIKDCKHGMAHYKVPKYVLIKKESEFPLTISGKVKKYEIQKISKELLGLGTVKSHFTEVVDN